MPGNSGSGNARDNRQRGNAAQLLEKYKSMARDAQLAGDRVQTDYFLQFAEHYFRVLEEGRSRFEESQQGQRRGRGRDDEDEDDGDETMLDGDGDDGDEDGDEPRQHSPRRDRGQDRTQDRVQDRGQDRGGDRSERNDRPQQQPQRATQSDRSERPRRPAPASRARFDNENEGDERLPAGILPPAIAIDEGDEQAAPAPRRRARKPREDSEGIAPAA